MEKEMLQELWDKFEAEEKELTFKHFTREDAWDLGLAVREYSKKIGKNVCIQITVNELAIFRYFPEGVTKNNLRWMERKHNMIMMRNMSSRRAEIMMKLQGKTLADWVMDPDQFAAIGGGFPIRVEGVGLIGSVCVSGLPAEEDHELLVEALREYFK